VLFVVCFVVGAAVQGDIPTYDDGGEAIADWYADNWREYLIGDFIIGLGFILFYFPFLVGLYARLRAADGEPAVFSRVALLGGILLPVAGLVGTVLNAALALLEGDVGSEVAATVSAAAFHTYVSLGGILTVFLGGAAIVILRSKAFWAWLGWLAAAIALVGILGSAASIEEQRGGSAGDRRHARLRRLRRLGARRLGGHAPERRAAWERSLSKLLRHALTFSSWRFDLRTRACQVFLAES